MSVGKKYVRVRGLAVLVPLVLGAVLISAKLLFGVSQVHVLLASSDELRLQVDQRPVEVTALSPSHWRIEVPRGSHSIDVFSATTHATFQVEVNGLSNLLLPHSGQCFAWLVGTPGHGRTSVARRYADSHVAIELPEDALVGIESVPPTLPASGFSVFVQIDCAHVTDSDEALLRYIDDSRPN
jgi:hypothetical protein